MNTMEAVRPRGTAGEVARPSRADVETLCVLHVVDRGHTTAAAVTEGMGLARELTPAIEREIETIVALGHLAVAEGGVSLRGTGREWLLRRLAELEAQ